MAASMHVLQQQNRVGVMMAVAGQGINRRALADLTTAQKDNMKPMAVKPRLSWSNAAVKSSHPARFFFLRT